MSQQFRITDRALREAIYFEVSTDDPFRKELGAKGLTESWFLKFGRPRTGYGVARTVRKETRLAALRRIEASLIRPLLSTTPHAVSAKFVDDLAQKLAAANLTNGRAISLLSKIAFMSAPARYAPLDQNARRALRQLEGSFPEGSYSAFMETFDKAYRRFAADVRRACEGDKALEYSKRFGLPASKLKEEWFLRRVFDWQLWLEGGGYNSKPLV